MIRRAVLVMVMLGWCFGSQPLWAGEMPAYYPANFLARGVVQRVDSHTFTFTIDAVSYRFTAALRVHTLTKERGYITTLKPGMKVGFTFITSGAQRIITEVWELPKNAVIPQV